MSLLEWCHFLGHPYIESTTAWHALLASYLCLSTPTQVHAHLFPVNIEVTNNARLANACEPQCVAAGVKQFTILDLHKFFMLAQKKLTGAADVTNTCIP